MINMSRAWFLSCVLQTSLGGERREVDFQANHCVVNVQPGAVSKICWWHREEFSIGVVRKGFTGKVILENTQSHWKNTTYQQYTQRHETAW